MNKYVVSALCAAVLLSNAYAAEQNRSGVTAEDLFLNSAKSVELTESEKLALENYENWSKSGARSLQKSYTGKDGSTIFTYGAQMPSIVCALLQITDIELERGEIINSVNVGDASRWSFEPATEGSGAATIQHVLVKPLDVGLETSLLITTNRRSYRLKLKAKDNQNYLPHVSFVYPDQALAKFKVLQQQQTAERERNSISVNGGVNKTYLGDLNFDYQIKGDVSWKPVRVFDDGKKVIIEMPQSMLHRTAPTLMVLDKEGGIFTDEKLRIVNYRLHGTRFIVDSLFDQAILTMDVGSDQQRVVIKKINK